MYILFQLTTGINPVKGKKGKYSRLNRSLAWQYLVHFVVNWRSNFAGMNNEWTKNIRKGLNCLFLSVFTLWNLIIINMFKTDHKMLINQGKQNLCRKVFDRLYSLFWLLVFLLLQLFTLIVLPSTLYGYYNKYLIYFHQPGHYIFN